MGVVATIGITVLTTVMLTEIYAWAPNLSRILVKLAARLAGEEQRARLQEEWLADLETFPASVWRLAHVTGYLLAGYRIKLEMTDAKIDAVATQMRHTAARLGAASRKLVDLIAERRRGQRTRAESLEALAKAVGNVAAISPGQIEDPVGRLVERNLKLLAASKHAAAQYDQYLEEMSGFVAALSPLSERCVWISASFARTRYLLLWPVLGQVLAHAYVMAIRKVTTALVERMHHVPALIAAEDAHSISLEPLVTEAKALISAVTGKRK
jgi:hypothetical protein